MPDNHPVTTWFVRGEAAGIVAFATLLLTALASGVGFLIALSMAGSVGSIAGGSAGFLPSGGRFGDEIWA